MEWLAEGARRLGSTDDTYEVLKGGLFEETELWALIVATILILTLGSLAAGAGIGGGGLFVPIYAFVLGVGAKAAVPLSKCTILGAAIGNFVSIGWSRHPHADRPLIDYETSTFMQSGELLGVIFGVLLNLLLPELLIIIFLAGLLSYNAVRTLRKGRTKWIQESEQFEKEEKSKDAASGVELAEASSAVPASEADLDHVVVAYENKEDDGQEKISGKPERSPELQKLYDDAAAQFPVWAWSIILLMTGFSVVYAVIKAELLSPCEPGVYWFFYFTPVIVLGGAMYVIAVFLNKLHEKRVAHGYEYIDGDIQFSVEQLKKFPTVSLLAGVAAGLLGIGGGMVIGPLFIEIGMQPQVGTSSCAFMILWTATSGVIQYYAAGKLGWEFMIWFMAFGFVSGQLGQRGVNKVLKQTGRPSIVVLLLGSIIGVACIAMTISGILKVHRPPPCGHFGQIVNRMAAVP